MLTDFLHMVERNWPVLLSGVELTLRTAVLSLFLALIWGALLYFLATRSGLLSPVSWVVRAYARFSRNTPLIAQLFFVFLGLPSIGLQYSAFTVAVIVIAGQHGCFLIRVFKGAIDGVPAVTVEAAKALGLDRRVTFRRVILPQAVTRAIPGVGSQLIFLVKDTSVASVIAVAEVTSVGKLAISSGNSATTAFLFAALVYLVLTSVLYGALSTFESHLRRVRG